MWAGGSHLRMSRCIRPHRTRPCWLRRQRARCQRLLTVKRNSYDSVSHLLSVLHQVGLNTLDGASYTYDHAAA